MSLLTATNLSKSYGPEDIFRDVSLSIAHRARIGLVGANGVGKTTLLRVLVGLEDPSGGEVLRSRGLRIGYLPQRPTLESHRTIWDECMTAFSAVLEQQAALARLEAAIAEQGEQADPALLDSYGKMQHAFENAGGYTFETRIRMTLDGLGFSAEDYRRPLTHVSGGQRTRAYLARLLLTDPDLLLLDEPTNHLDISAIEWLEAYLRDWNGAVLLVSHDRYFLDQVATETWEMTPQIEAYRGNYSAYLNQRAERYQRVLAEYQAQQEFIEKEEEYIRRNIAGQNTRQAQGRRKRLERLLETALLAPPVQSRALHFRLEPAARSGDLVVRTNGLGVGYQDEGRVLFRVPNLTLVRGECAGIIGPNGAGKTTFLKTLLGQLPPLLGDVTLGAALNIGYFAQAHEGLEPESNLMEAINQAAPRMLPAEIRDYLAKFMFTGDDVFKQVKVLSGGERGRLALARLALSNANLLLLDEPTNHLDLPSQEVLQSVLGGFKGTILLVSHDRFLIDALATQIWEVQPEQGLLRVFEGDYSQYRAARQAEAAAQAQAQKPAAPAAQPAAQPRPASGRASNNRERERLQRIAQAEARVAELEKKQAELERQLENPPADAGQVLKLGQDYQRLEAELEAAMQEWMELSEA